MSLTERLWRMSVAWLVAVTLATGAALAATPTSAPSTAHAAALPEPLTKESVRELVARLSDDEVRKLLLEQLDRAAAASKTPDEKSMAGMVGQNAGMMHVGFVELWGALVAMPDTLREVGAKLTEPDGASRLLVLAGLLAAALGVGWIAERAFDAVLRGYRERLGQTPGTSFTANAFRLATGLSLDVVGLAVFGLAALATLLVFWHEHDLQRRAMFEVLVAVVIVRVAVLLARFLLAPQTAARLLPLADAPARDLRWYAMTIAVIYSAAQALVTVMHGAGASATAVDAVMVGLTVLGLAVTVWTVWRVRVPIAGLIRGDDTPGAVTGWVADLWPVIATAYLAVIAGARIYGILSGEPEMAGLGILSILVVVALPIVDMAFCRALAAAAATPQTTPPAMPEAMPAASPQATPEAMPEAMPEVMADALPEGMMPEAMPTAAEGAAAHEGSPHRGFVASYESVLRHAIHIVVTVVGLLLIGALWDINVFALAQQSLGGKISSSLLGICIVLLLAYMLWEVAKTAIDRRLLDEGDLDPDLPASRLRTLLPLLRALILITIVVMATMSLLAALGVDILPLLAGASVVGVAIGFGSQTLIRDIVSGAFFLMDDAFRLGEYIEVGDAKGRVEKINIRSLFLRHHRGAINILPYGEIKRLRNTSRDWMILVMDFRLTYDTNLMTVKKILKQIGDEIALDEELAPDLIRAPKFAGVMSTEDSAIVVRVKFTARPATAAPYMIQKATYTKILKAFREAGIKFAHRQVTVYVPPSADGDQTAAAAGGAALAVQSADKKR